MSEFYKILCLLQFFADFVILIHCDRENAKEVLECIRIFRYGLLR